MARPADDAMRMWQAAMASGIGGKAASLHVQADMSPRYARAIVAVEHARAKAARHQFADPARHQTWRSAMAGIGIVIVAGGAFYLAVDGKLTDSAAKVAIATVAALAAAPTIGEWVGSKRKPPTGSAVTAADTMTP